MRIFQFILLVILGGCDATLQEFSFTNMIRDDEFRTPIVTFLIIRF